MLIEMHRQHLARFGIDDELIKKARIESVSDPTARDIMGIHGRQADDLSGIFFPYLSPLTGDRLGGRLRLDVKTGDDAKYIMEQGCRFLYFAPAPVQYLKDVGVPLFIVEAEKSALAMCALSLRSSNTRLLAMATGGCWGWKRNDGKVEKPNGGAKSTSGPSPSFDLLELAGRNVFIAFDSNSSDHSGVRAAREALAQLLAERKAIVRIVDIPQEKGVNGPDDYIEANGDEEMIKLTRRAKIWKEGPLALLDMPRAVLSGRLGEICERCFARDFPIAYAWPALVTVASALAPRYNDSQKINLYTALVGPVHSGKTQVIDRAQEVLRIEEPALMPVMAGSAELLALHMQEAFGSPRLFSPDELSHVMEKASIMNASFASILNRAFYHTKFPLRIGGKSKSADIDASLSILGGIVESRFEDLFSATTTTGLYDRFLFGLCPSEFRFDYMPFDESINLPECSQVFVSPDVWVEKSKWLKENLELSPRVVEIGLRVAIICASFDQKTLLCVEDLPPALALIQYEHRIRKILRPNEGANTDGVIAFKLLSKLEGSGGKFVSKRELFTSTNIYRYGPPAVDRVLKTLQANGEIEVTEKTRPIMIRRLNMNGDGE